MKLNKDFGKPFTGEELDLLVLSVELKNIIVAFNGDDLRDRASLGSIESLLIPASVPGKLSLLVTAAPYLYQELGRQFHMLQSMSDLWEQIAAKTSDEALARLLTTFVDTVTEMQNQIMIARRIATDGPVKVSNDVAKDR